MDCAPKPRATWVEVVPAVTLCVLVAAVFQHAAGGAPRADQLVYQYHAGLRDGALDILWGSPNWNRAYNHNGAHDAYLYRPGFYLLSGLLRVAFGVAPAGGQVTGVVLHTAVVLLVHDLMRRSMAPPIAFLLAAWFAVHTAGCEMVLWGDICGYLLWAVWTLLSLRGLMIHLDSGTRPAACQAVLFGGLSAFTQEFGVVFACVAAIGCWLGGHRRLAAAFSAILVGYAACSTAGFVGQFGPPSPPEGAIPASALQLGDRAAAGAWGLLVLPVAWLVELMMPLLLTFGISERTTLVAALPQTGPFLYVNLGAAALLLAAVPAHMARVGRVVDARCLARTVAAPAAFVVGFVGLIVLGRLIPRGLSDVLLNNTYYVYFFAVSASSGLAWVGWRLRKARLPPVHPGARLALLGGLVAMIGLNASGTASIAGAVRDRFTSRREAIQVVELWHRHSATGRYFAMSPECDANVQVLGPRIGFLPTLFRPAVPREAGVLDVLFPRSSALLSGIRDPVRIDVLPCR